MKRIIYAAAALLVIQIGLVIAFTGGGEENQAFVPEAPFLGIDPQQITSVQISDNSGNTLTMIRKDSSWILPEAADAPVDKAQLQDLLNRLAGEKRGFAVATTEAAAPRFKVAPDDFERHLVLQGSSGGADLYVGSAAGFRRSHVRLKDENEVVTIGIGTFDIEPTTDHWLDKGLLKCKREELSALLFPDFTITRDNEQWHLADATPQEELQAKPVEDLLDSICGLTVMTIITPAQATPAPAGEAALAFTVRNRDGNETAYRFTAMPAEENAYMLTVSGRQAQFKVYGWQVDELKSFNRVKMTSPSQPEATGPTPPPSTGGS